MPTLKAAGQAMQRDVDDRAEATLCG